MLPFKESGYTKTHRLFEYLIFCPWNSLQKYKKGLEPVPDETGGRFGERCIILMLYYINVVL